MKLLIFHTCLFLYLSLLTTMSLLSQDDKLKKSTSSFGVLLGYAESIVRSGVFNNDYYNAMNKEMNAQYFRGYVVGISYNKQLQDNDNLATFTGELLFQKLPMYDETSIGGSFFRDHEPQRPPTLAKITIPNYMVTTNGMYNFNLFNSGVALSIGVSLGYVLSKNSELTAVVDSNVIDLVNSSNLTPLEPFEFGKEATFTYKYSPSVNQFRLGLIVGLTYNLYVFNSEIEPFIRYNIAITNHSLTTLYEDYLHSLQTGLSVRIPF